MCLPLPERLGQPEAWAPFPRVRAPFPSEASGPSSQRLGRPLPGCGVPFPSAAPVCAGRVSESLSIGTRGLFAVWEGVASLGLSFPLSPPPCPYLQRGWPALLWSFSVPLFCEPPAVCSGQLIFSLAIPQFKRAPCDCSQGLLLVLTLSNAAHSSPFRPHLLEAGAGVWGTFLLGVAFRHVICGPYLIFPPSLVAL